MSSMPTPFGLLAPALAVPLALAALPTHAAAQWLDFSEETGTRLSLSTVALDDGEEKDIAAGDLDRDGWVDVVVVRKAPFSTPGARQDVLLMNEGGVLTDRTTTLAAGFVADPTDARDVFIADVTGDMWLDVIIANTFSQQPKLYINLGEDLGGNWLGLADESAARLPVIVPTDQNPGPGPLFCGVWAADIDNDLDTDIMFSNYNPGGADTSTPTQDILLINDGSGIFTNETDARLGDRDNVAFGTGVILEDMNNDGWRDIVKISTLFSVTPWNGIGIYQLYNDQTGNFTSTPWQETPNDAPYMMGVGDFDNNDIKDVFVVGDGQDQICMGQSINGNGTVNYSFSEIGPSSRTSGFGGNIRLVDMDDDDDLDLLVCPVDVDIQNCSGSEAGEITLLRWNGTTFSDPYGPDQNFHLRPHDAEVLDINNDGCPDIFMGLCTGWAIFVQSDCSVIGVEADVAVVAQPQLAVRPNPFNGTTVVALAPFAIAATGNVTVDVFDATGARVIRLFEGDADTLPTQVTWDGSTDSGVDAAAGTYFVRATSATAVANTKLVRVE